MPDISLDADFPSEPLPRQALVRHVAFLALSAALFAACLAFNGYYTGSRSANGGLLLAIGWLGLSSGEFAWLANPLLLLAGVSYSRRRYRQAMLFSLVAIGLMLSFLLTGKIIVSEAPTYARVTGYGLGYGLWVSSGLVLLLGSIVCRKSEVGAA